jgi:hypothetical protein
MHQQLKESYSVNKDVNHVIIMFEHRDVHLYLYTIIIYSGSSTHRSVFQGGPAIYIYIMYVKLHYDYIKIIKYLQIFKDYIYLIGVGKSSVQLDKMFLFGFKELKINRLHVLAQYIGDI